VYQSRGCIACPPPPNRGPQADGAKLPLYDAIPPSFSTMDAMAIFRIFASKFDTLPRWLLPYRIVSLFPYSPLSDGKVISNSDDLIFSNRGPNCQNLPLPQTFWGQVRVRGVALVRYRVGFNYVPLKFSRSPPNFWGLFEFRPTFEPNSGGYSAPRYRGIALPQLL